MAGWRRFWREHRAAACRRGCLPQRQVFRHLAARGRRPKGSWRLSPRRLPRASAKRAGGQAKGRASRLSCRGNQGIPQKGRTGTHLRRRCVFRHAVARGRSKRAGGRAKDMGGGGGALPPTCKSHPQRKLSYEGTASPHQKKGVRYPQRRCVLRHPRCQRPQQKGRVGGQKQGGCGGLCPPHAAPLHKEGAPLPARHMPHCALSDRRALPCTMWVWGVSPTWGAKPPT